jgi:integrase
LEVPSALHQQNASVLSQENSLDPDCWDLCNLVGFGPSSGGAMTPPSIVVWFNRAFKNIGLKGCSSHSGRRTFVTRAARIVHKAGGSLRDVQLLAGHRSIQTTQRYIDGDTDAQRKLVSLI